ncbi:MAG: hypothetical protein AAGE52_42500 [Myxococcota bacterium]
MTRGIRIVHTPTGTLLAEGPRGWGITPFEGNFYIQRRFLRTDGFQTNYIPGICFYKFVYVWMDLVIGDVRSRSLGWKYVLPNPVFPFIWFRVAVPGRHPELHVETFEGAQSGREGAVG